MNHNLQKALKQPKFRWFAKHLNHIAENIVFKKRNVSFLAINALFRLKDAVVRESPFPFEGSYQIVGFVALQKNDRLRTKAEEMTVMFRVDKKLNIIIITAFSESDEF